MEWYHILLIVIVFLILIVLITSYICFRMTCYVKRSKELKEYSFPEGSMYEPFTGEMIEAVHDALAMPHEKFQITSFDGLKLQGYYFEYHKDAPIEILFHGYKGEGLRDLAIGIKRCHRAEHSVLLVDQRASGASEGKVLSFGINERKDCLSWVDFAIKHFGDDVKIILSGVSMGAGTVVMASAMDLPKNVIGILADCGYDSPKNIIKKCITEMKLPANFFYPFVRLGNIIFGHFDLDSDSPIEACKKTNLPIIFFHGDKDYFVPTAMSVKMYEACNSRKKLVLIKDAGHGLAYLFDKDYYVQEVIDFFNKEKKMQINRR